MTTYLFTDVYQWLSYKTSNRISYVNLNGNEIDDQGVHFLTNSLADYNTTLKFLHLSSDQTINDTMY